MDLPGAVTTVDGSITITGTSAPCGNACLGTSIRGNVTATGTGAINITGTGGVTNGAFPVHGANVRTGGVVSATNGNITITGTGGSGSTTGDNAGFNLASSGTGTVQTTGSGTITVNADTIKIATNPNATINAAANAVSLRQKTNGVAINLGSTVDNTASTLELSDAELDRVTGGTLNLGNANSGAITVSANITRPAATILNLTSALPGHQHLAHEHVLDFFGRYASALERCLDRQATQFCGAKARQCAAHLANRRSGSSNYV